MIPRQFRDPRDWQEQAVLIYRQGRKEAREQRALERQPEMDAAKAAQDRPKGLLRLPGRRSQRGKR